MFHKFKFVQLDLDISKASKDSEEIVPSIIVYRFLKRRSNWRNGSATKALWPTVILAAGFDRIGSCDIAQLGSTTWSRLDDMPRGSSTPRRSPDRCLVVLRVARPRIVQILTCLNHRWILSSIYFHSGMSRSPWIIAIITSGDHSHGHLINIAALACSMRRRAAATSLIMILRKWRDVNHRYGYHLLYVDQTYRWLSKKVTARSIDQD